MGIDETPARKDHNYVTLGVDVDAVRKAERKEHQALKGHNTILNNPDTLSAAQQTQLAELLRLYPTLGEACRLKTV